MRGFMVALIIAPLITWADSSVTVPWPEFSGLYRERIEHDLKQQQERAEPSLHSIDEALFHLTITGRGATGRVLIRGQMLRGEPTPVSLFDNDVAITEVAEAVGAQLLTTESGYHLIPAKGKPFRVVIGIAIPMRYADGERYLRFSVPRAVQNALELEVPNHLRLKEDAAIKIADGRYYFRPTEGLRLAFDDLMQTANASNPSIDTFTEFEAINGRFTATSYFSPRRPPPGPITLQLDPKARVFASSVPTDWLTVTGDGGVQVNLAANWQRAFVIQYEIFSQSDTVLIQLPRVLANTGRENEFTVRPGVNAQIRVSGDNVVAGIPVTRLPQPIAAETGARGTYYQLTDPQTSVALTHQPFERVPTPERVLDAVYFFTRFTENGDQLATLRVTLPARSGDRLVMHAIPDAEIWSVSVNGVLRDVYAQGTDRWIVPLDVNADSSIELAFLRRGAKLGLEGRLDLTLPATGLTARAVHVAISLAKRVQLVAFDSELTPAPNMQWPNLRELEPPAYFFTRPFYRGDVVRASIYYQEPVSAIQEGESS